MPSVRITPHPYLFDFFDFAVELKDHQMTRMNVAQSANAAFVRAVYLPSAPISINPQSYHLGARSARPHFPCFP
jgi:hypothetical protein